MVDRRVVVLAVDEENPASSDGQPEEDDGSQEVIISPKASAEASAAPPPEIPQVSTFDSSFAEEDIHVVTLPTNIPGEGGEERFRRRWSINSTRRTDVLDRLSEALKEASHHDDHFDFSLFGSWEDVVSQIFYIAMFSVFGTVVRIYMGRIFGLDCQWEEAGRGIGDFITPFSSSICITSDGKMQAPGALFIDLPANMLGW